MKDKETLFANFLEGRISETEIRDLLKEDPSALEEFLELKELYLDLPDIPEMEVSAETDRDFYALLESEKKKNFWKILKPAVDVAAMLTLIAGGYFWGANQQAKEPEITETIIKEKPIYITQTIRDTVITERAVVKPFFKNQTDSELEDSNKLDQIHQELDQITQIQQQIILAMLRQESAASRIEAINYSYNVNTKDPTLINALFEILEKDPSINVSLAALEAIGRHELDSKQREDLVLTLAERQDPSLKTALMSKLIDLKETKALPVLVDIATDPFTPKDIRTQAEKGIYYLTSN